MGRLDGKVALISGGARGQGAAEAQLCAREGAKVVFGDVLDEQGKQLEAEIRASGGEATYVHLDVTREADWREAIEPMVLVAYKLNSAIERGTKPDAVGGKPCHWTSTLKAAMVNAKRA